MFNIKGLVFRSYKNSYNSLGLFPSPIPQRQTTQLAVHPQSKGWPGNGCVSRYGWSACGVGQKKRCEVDGATCDCGRGLL